jgi:hypothetical protein
MNQPRIFLFDLEEAADYLSYLIRRGVEYPDAEYRASVKFDVDATELRAEYDSRTGA